MVLDLANETRLLEFYVCTVIGSFGIVSNLFNIIVSSRSKIQEITTIGFFFVYLSCINIAFFVFAVFLFFFPQSIGKDELVTTSIYACLFIPYFTRVFAVISGWLNVFISYDRICIFKVNYDEHFLNNRKNLKIIGFVMFVVACVLCMPNLLFHLETQTQYDSSTNMTQITTICTASNSIQSLRDASAALIRIIIPNILQIVLNVILIMRLFQFRRNHDPTLKKEKRFAFTIVILNTIYLLGEIPYLICLALINIYGYNPSTYISTSSNESAISSFAFICCWALLLAVSFSLLPFVNYFTNKKYRKEVKKMLGLKVKEDFRRPPTAPKRH